jgi:threonine aldolase
MLGGAMRQTGIYAAAGIHALQHHLQRLAEDHANARRLAQVLAESPAIDIDPARVATNIVVFRLRDGACDAATLVTRAAALGVKVFAFAPRTVRAVTHLDVDGAQCERAARLLVQAAGEPAA